MSTESLSTVYQQTVRLYGQAARHAVDAYCGIARRAISGVDRQIVSALNSDRMAFVNGFRGRLGSAHRSVSGAIGGGVVKVHDNTQGLIDAAVKAASGGIDAVAGLAGRLDAKYPQVASVTAPARQVGLPAARLTRDVARYVATGAERLADRLGSTPVARTRKAVRAAKAGARKATRKASAAARPAPGRRARKA
jgi:hypothetical protein